MERDHSAGKPEQPARTMVDEKRDEGFMLEGVFRVPADVNRDTMLAEGKGALYSQLCEYYGVENVFQCEPPEEFARRDVPISQQILYMIRKPGGRPTRRI